ncbi:MAG: sugar-binding transcriptional regulator [Tissierellaceae bacterium]
MKNISSEDIKLLIEIAYMYYDEGAKQSDIGKKYNISRSLVSRYLKKAKEYGVVEILIHDELLHPYYELEQKLKKEFSLKDVICVESADNKLAQKRRVANAAAKYFLRQLKEFDVVAITGGTTIDEVSNLIAASTNYSNVTFVSMTGGFGGETTHIQANIICEKFATKLGAKVEYLYAPVLVDSLEAKNVFISQTYIKNVLNTAKNADVLLTGIGGFPSFSTLANAHLDQILTLTDDQYNNIVGDFCYNFIDKDGKLIDSEWNDRVITLSIDEVQNIPNVIAVAEGDEKIESIYASLKAELIDVLVTDKTTGSNLLEYLKIRNQEG